MELTPHEKRLTTCFVNSLLFEIISKFLVPYFSLCTIVVEYGILTVSHETQHVESVTTHRLTPQTVGD